MSPDRVDDASIPGTPMWWLRRLNAAQDARDAALVRYEDYYSGKHNLQFASEKFRQRFGGLFAPLQDNFCDLIADAVEERLNVQGFRVPTAPQQTPGRADLDTWGIWQRNNLDQYAQIGHSEALVAGEAHALVWPVDGKALITIEHARQMIVATDALNPLVVRAALKRWVDDSGYVFATLYLPEAVYKYRTASKAQFTDETAGWKLPIQETTWVHRIVQGENWPIENPTKPTVPVVPLRNRPRLLVSARSEIHQIIPIQDAINKEVADMLLASEHQAFRQRALLGMEPLVDPVTGENITDTRFKQILSEKIWVVPPSGDGGPNPSIWEGGQVDLKVYVAAIEMLVQHAASRSRTPPHYFYQAGIFPSGESIKAAETGLVAKVRRKMTSFGHGWEETIRLARQIEGLKQPSDVRMEIIWGDPESRTEAEHADAMVKALAIGIPEEAVWEKWGASPEEIERWKEMRREEAALGPARRGVSNSQAVSQDAVTKALMAAGVSNGQGGPVG